MINKNKAEETIIEYFNIDKLIRDEEMNCMNPHTEIDENVGGGSSGRTISTTEIKGESLIMSRRLDNLKEIRRVVGIEYECLSDYEKSIVRLYYKVEKSPRRTDKHVKELVGVPVNHVRGVRVNFLEKVAYKLGL